MSGHSKRTRNMPVIQVNLKSVYGNVMAYPANEAAQIFADIAGSKTLSQEALRKIMALGYQVKAVDPLAMAFA